jgi:hypothetical protein
VLNTPRRSRRISVPITETMIDPRQPDLLEKKRNKASCYPMAPATNGGEPTAGLEPATSSVSQTL